MSGLLRSSLSAYIPWQIVLRLLRVQSTPSALPAAIECPFCSGPRLLIVHDFEGAGQWYSCDSCKWCGDAIELLSKHWGLSLRATIAKLSVNGVAFDEEALTPERIAKYSKDYIEPRERVANFWRDSQKKMLVDRNSVISVMRSLKLNAEASSDQWLRGVGQMLGCCHKFDAEKLYMPSVAKYLKSSRANPSQFRLFKGSSWKDVLVMPYFDMQKRIRSFMFVGREGRWPEDFVFRTMRRDTITSKVKEVKHEAGLAMHPDALNYLDNWDNYVLAVHNPTLAVRLQIIQFRSAIMPLPVVSWRSDVQNITRQSWQLLRKATPVFWTNELLPELVHQAVLTNGRINMTMQADVYSVKMKQRLYREPIRDLMHSLFDNSRHWSDVLNEHWMALEDNLLEEQLLLYSSCDNNLSKLIEGVSPELADRIEKHLKSMHSTKQAALSNQVFVEQDDAWYCQQTGKAERLVSDAVIRIDRVIHYKRQNKIYYAGRIIFKGETEQFCALRKEVENNPGRWLQDLLIVRQLGLAQIDSRWSRKLIEIALKFQQPKVEAGIECIGWDEETQGFVFPNYTIESTGTIKDHQQIFLPENVPARYLSGPKDMLPSSMANITVESDSARLFWAVAASVSAQLIAPAFGATPSNLALTGESATIATRIASLLGCMRPKTVKPADIATCREAHNWPVLIDQKHQAVAINKMLREDHLPYGHILPLNWDLSRALLVDGRWVVIDTPANISLPERFIIPASELIPAYLYDLCQRGLHLEGDQERLPIAVLEDMAKWAERNAGDPEVILRAASIMRMNNAEGSLLAFGELLADAFFGRQLLCEPLDYADPKEKRPRLIRETLEGRPETVFIPAISISMLCSLKKVVPIDPLRITELLSTAGVLVEEIEAYNLQGWRVLDSWWTKTTHNWRSGRTGLLKLFNEPSA